MARILIIDSVDGDRVRDALLAHRHAVVIAATAAEGLTALEVAEPHIVVMDHVLPDGNGLMLLPRIGRRPLIVLSAADDQQTRVMALRSGADDFMSKPWDDEELGARVGAVMRRCYSKPLMIDSMITIGELVIAYGDVRVNGKWLALTKTEHLILATLASRIGRVVEREELLEVIYAPKGEVGDWHSVEVHVGRLKRKLIEAGVERVNLRTVRGLGMMLDYVPDA